MKLLKTSDPKGQSSKSGKPVPNLPWRQSTHPPCTWPDAMPWHHTFVTDSLRLSQWLSPSQLSPIWILLTVAFPFFKRVSPSFVIYPELSLIKHEHMWETPTCHRKGTGLEIKAWLWLRYTSCALTSKVPNFSVASLLPAQSFPGLSERSHVDSSVLGVSFTTRVIRTGHPLNFTWHNHLVKNLHFSLHVKIDLPYLQK